ncbi:FeS assembly SUF system protein [Thiothrix caldifontis]|uniref:FeS assembly SUF system protein n=1 Tax=Thiothrix caldifontis TaxID=525918 RepID=A0A1H4G3C5_9GAMM|nr:DUF59 domain-containing protein [Thiothrix caldifontis]SEB04085.1 FeS assembly SUF system protein [Thiothrix caldifontis]
MFKLSRLAKAKAAEQYADPLEAQRAWLRGEIINALRQVYDPEIPVNIYDLGLIYALTLDDNNNVHIKMTLTSPGCPVAGSLPGQVEAAARSPIEVNDVTVELVWSPPWNQSRMSEAARLQLDMF